MAGNGKHPRNLARQQSGHKRRGAQANRPRGWLRSMLNIATRPHTVHQNILNCVESMLGRSSDGCMMLWALGGCMPLPECSPLVGWRTGRSIKLLPLIIACRSHAHTRVEAIFVSGVHFIARTIFLILHIDRVCMLRTPQGLWNMGKVSPANYRTS